MSSRHVSRTIPLFLALFCFSPSFASAKIFNVFNVAQLRNALTVAGSNGQADTINIAAGNYSSSGGKFYYAPGADEHYSISISGAGMNKTQFNGGSEMQILDIDTRSVTDDAPVQVLLRNIAFHNAHMTSDHGPVEIVTNKARVTVQGCRFKDNSGQDGGGLYIDTDTGSVAFKNNVVQHNASGSTGGGIYLRHHGIAALVFTGNKFITNTSVGEGGGLYLYADSSAAVTFQGNTISENVSTGDGAGAYINNHGAINFVRNTVRMNTINSGGRPPTGGRGGGLYLNDGTGGMNVSDNLIGDNEAVGGGGGIYLDCSGTATVAGNMFTFNQSGQGPGGLFVFTNEDLNLEANSFIGNTGQEGGGLLVSFAGPVTMRNCVFLTNHALNGGGGAQIYGSTTPHLINNTFARNQAAIGGGILLSFADGTQLFNNIFWENAAGTDGNAIYLHDLNNETINMSHNLFLSQDFYSDCTNTPGCTAYQTWDNNYSGDPLFVGLGDPDPLKWNARLQIGSVCVDRGSDSTPDVPSRDRDFVPRPLDGDKDGSKIIDIGAYELYRSVVVVSPNGGEVIPGGSIYTIRWVAPKAAVRFAVSYSTDNGLHWTQITDEPIAKRFLRGRVPVPAATRGKCLVKVTGYKQNGSPLGTDRSDAVFTITKP